jgi:hypothetical protein
MFMQRNHIISTLLLTIAFFAVTKGNSINKITDPKTTPDPAIVSHLAEKSTFTLHWYSRKAKNVMVVARMDQVCNTLPKMDDSYLSNSVYGKGSLSGGGFVVYKGEGTSATISGLKPGKKYYFHVYEIDAEGRYTSDRSILEQPENETENAMKAVAVVTCACPPIAGVTCSVTGTTNTGTSVASAAACPHVGYCNGPGTNNPWSSAAGTGVVQYLFSSPVSAATLRANSVNTNDYATVSASGGSGGALSISGVVCMGVSGLVIGPLTVASSYGGVSWTVNSTGSYTMVTCTNTGAQSGWVATCPTAITPVVLPIELVSLKAVCESGYVDLRWQTSSETNNSYFAIQRSFDTENWETIGQIAGAGNSSALLNYNYSDRTLYKSSAYYRLKQVDLDNKYKSTEMVSVQNCKKAGGDINVTIYPNPSSGEVTVKSELEGVTLEIYDVFGRLSGSQILTEGENKVNISELPNGTYFFRSGNEISPAGFTKVIVSN